MKKLSPILILLPMLGLLLVSATSVHAQNTTTIQGTGAPTGSCAFVLFYIDSSTGNFYNCKASAWNLVGGSGGIPGGANTQVQYNSSGAFAGNAAFTFNSGTGFVTANGYTSANANGGISGSEGTGANVTTGVGIDAIYPDASCHTFHVKANGVDSGCLGAGAFSSGGGGQTYFGFCGGTINATAGTYGFVNFGVSPTLGSCGAYNSALGVPISQACTLQNLAVRSVTGGVNASDGVILVEKNGGTTTGLTCTLGTGTSCTSATGGAGAAVNAGDWITVKNTTQTSSSLSSLAFSVQCK